MKPCVVSLAGSKGVGAIFTRVPQVMLFKPSTNDRWDRRVVQLAAFMHHHGHCNVPEVGTRNRCPITVCIGHYVHAGSSEQLLSMPCSVLTITQARC